eukprot:m.15970 g.15970  ORF g.15970 m.15970 type:complete len:601 (-) comp10128_c0_seq1:43-1845(-)
MKQMARPPTVTWRRKSLTTNPLPLVECTTKNTSSPFSRHNLAPFNAEAFFNFTQQSTSGNTSERVYGFGELENTAATGGCDTNPKAYPVARSDVKIDLDTHKFHVSIPFFYSSLGYGFLMNLPGTGHVTVGQGNVTWSLDAALQIDFWVTTTSASSAINRPNDIYHRYADATGHAPMIKDNTAMFWQSRLRYRNQTEFEQVATQYHKLNVSLGVLVVDFFNQNVDGDFELNPKCYWNVSDMIDTVHNLTGTDVMVSLWPDVKNTSLSYFDMSSEGCLAGGMVDPTSRRCRDFMWSTYVKPNYHDQGVTAYWLDETDIGVGLGQHVTTACGPYSFCGRFWANTWIQTFSDGMVAENETPLVLTRGLWAGAQRYGVVLWSSDIFSTFEELTAQVPEGISASMSGVPWWTTDVGGFGCPTSPYNNTSPYMSELIVRWYQFGSVSSIFRTHGCRAGQATIFPDDSPCITGQGPQGSCGGNEVWSYAPEVQPLLLQYINFRNTELKPYILELAKNVSETGVPTMRPLFFNFPNDPDAIGHDYMFMLGDRLLAAPVTTQGQRNQTVYFPKGPEQWYSYWNHSETYKPGESYVVDAPLEVLPLFSWN